MTPERPHAATRRPIGKTAFVVCLAIVMTSIASRVSADVTLFTGVNTTPSNRSLRGFSAGLSLLVVGFEFEYSKTREDDLVGAPSLTTGMFNILFQTPFPISGLQFYGTTGGGIYRERLGELQETQVGMNFGGGVKISIAGPLRARIDYRVFTLRGSPLASKLQRIYFGLNVAF